MTTQEKINEIRKAAQDTKLGQSLFAVAFPMGNRYVEDIEKAATDMSDWKDMQAKKAFCLACCEGKPTKDTCSSLGTCEAYDNFCKHLREGI